MLLYESELQTLGSAQAVAGAVTTVTNFLILQDVGKTIEQYPEGHDGAAIHFSLTLSSGGTSSGVTIRLYCVPDGVTADTLRVHVGYAPPSELAAAVGDTVVLSTANLNQAGTTTFTLNVQTKHIGPVVKIGLIRVGGDRTVAVTTKARRFKIVRHG